MTQNWHSRAISWLEKAEFRTFSRVIIFWQYQTLGFLRKSLIRGGSSEDQIFGSNRTFEAICHDQKTITPRLLPIFSVLPVWPADQ